MDNIYSAYHYACKTKADREVVEELAPKVIEAAASASFGNIGDIKYTVRTDVPNGGEWCDGAEYTQSKYPDLYKMLTQGKLQYVDIDTYNSVVELNGSCGLFGLDSANKKFRVPSIPALILTKEQAAVVGNGMTLGLDMSAGNAYAASTSGTPSLQLSANGGNIGDSVTGWTNAGGSQLIGVTTDPAKSGIVANLDTVEAKAYVILYSGIDLKADITKQVQLNNPFFLGMSQWFDCDPNNASWLLSNGSYHSGATYKSFYEWLVSEYNEPNRLPRRVNADVVGNPVISEGVVGGFGKNDYLEIPTEFNPASNNWELSIKFVMGSDVSTTDWLLGNGTYGILLGFIGGKCGLWLSSNGTSWNIVDDKRGSTVLASGKTYYLKIGFTSSEYYIDISSDGEVFNRELSIANTASVFPSKLLLGNGWDREAPFTGSIDTTSCSITINNQIWWKGVDNAIRKPTEQYTNYDYIINTESRTFKLPLKSRTASGNAVIGNGMTLGLTDGTRNSGVARYGEGFIERAGIYGEPVGSSITGSSVLEGLSIGVTTDPTKSGIETSSSGLKLYFYVGETIQDANVINASGVLTELAKKVNKDEADYVVESFKDGNNWYRVYKSGWVEQGGIAGDGTKTSPVIVNLLKPMAEDNYNILATFSSSGYREDAIGVTRSSRATIRLWHNANSNYIYWFVYGQGE